MMSAEDIRLVAEAKTGLSREPTCNATQYGAVGVGTTRQQLLGSPYRAKPGRVEHSQGPTTVHHSAAKKPTSMNRRSLRKAEKQRRKKEKRQKRRDKKVDAALEW